MSKIKIALFALVGLFITSCGSDSTADLLPGTWNFTKISNTNCADPSDEETINFGSDNCITEFGAEICNEGTWMFTEGGQVTISIVTSINGVPEDGDTTTGTYTIQDDDSMVELCFDGECFTGTINITETTFTWSANIFGCTSTYEAVK